MDAGRGSDPHGAVYSMMKSMFTLEVPLNNNQHEIHPKSCNDLRHQLYIRAKENGPAASVCRRLLADIECMRREDDRPSDEFRHPVADGETAWTEMLTLSD